MCHVWFSRNVGDMVRSGPCLRPAISRPRSISDTEHNSIALLRLLVSPTASPMACFPTDLGLYRVLFVTLGMA